MNGAVGGQQHFVDVWNPSYASNAMEAHLALLLEAARRFERKELGEDARHVWWGKVRGRSRNMPMSSM